MIIMKLFMILALTFSLASCDLSDIIGDDDDDDDSQERVIIIPFGETVLIDGEPNITVSFADVVEDSRCPEDAECVWEGDAHIKLNFTTPPLEKLTQLDLHTNEQFTTEVEYEGYEFEIKRLLPKPLSDREIEKEDYIVHLEVELPE